MQRLTAHTEVTDDIQTSLACITNPLEGKIADQVLTRMGIQTELDEMEEQPLFTIEISNDKGGKLVEAMTKPEATHLLKGITVLDEETFEKALAAETSVEIGHHTVSVTPWEKSEPEKLDENGTDLLTELLKALHAEGGKHLVFQTLRTACVHYCCESLQNGADHPDSENLEELAQAILTPCFLQETALAE